MKPSDLFDRLPSLSQLLDHPQVRQVVNRVSHSQAAARAEEFLGRVRQEVSRRSADWRLPSISELADRAARFIADPPAGPTAAAINATGRLWPAELGPPALPELVRRRIAQSLGGYDGDAPESRVEARLAQLTGCEAAIVTSSHLSAVQLVLAAMGSEGIAVARGDLGTLDRGLRLTDLGDLAGASLIEVGASDSATVADYLAVASAPLALRREWHGWSGAVCRPAATDLARELHAAGRHLVIDAGRLPLVDCGIAGLESLPGVRSLVAAGTDLVLARGDGISGGPECGLVLGKKELVDRLRAHRLTALHPPIRSSLAGLEATLELLAEPPRARLEVPVLACLATPTENLRLRAERLAAQIAAGGLPATPVLMSASEATLAGLPPLESWAIALTPANESPADLRSRLAGSAEPLWAGGDANRVLLHLRTVYPQHDIALVDACR